MQVFTCDTRSRDCLTRNTNCLFSISFIADNRKCISFLHGCSCGKNALNIAPEGLMEYFLVYGGPTIWRNNYMPLAQILTQTWSVQLYSYTISIWQKYQCCFLLLVVCILPRKNNQMTMKQVYPNAGATMLSLSLIYKSLSTSPFNVGLITYHMWLLVAMLWQHLHVTGKNPLSASTVNFTKCTWKPKTQRTHTLECSIIN